MRRYVLPFVTSALLVASLSAQEAQLADRSKPVQLTQITIEGNTITSDDVLMRKGVAYVSVPALARALGASVASQGAVAVLSVPAAPEPGCGNVPDAVRLSDDYRKAAVHIPDAIESLRILVSKPGAVISGASFDDVDHQVAEADFRAQTEADKAVSYALSHANSTLAIMYYKLRRGVPADYAKQSQMDSIVCEMESKFALQVGRLSGKETCSVFHDSASAAETKTTASK